MSHWPYHVRFDAYQASDVSVKSIVPSLLRTSTMKMSGIAELGVEHTGKSMLLGFVIPAWHRTRTDIQLSIVVISTMECVYRVIDVGCRYTLVQLDAVEGDTACTYKVD